jgi:hypothetical protein
VGCLEKLRSIGFEVITTSPTDAMDYFESEIAWGKILLQFMSLSRR